MLIQLSPPTFSRPAKWRVHSNVFEWEKTSTGENTSTVPKDSLSQCEISSTPRGEISSTSKETLLKDTLPKKTRSAPADDRFQPFVQFAHEEFTRLFGCKLDFNKTDGKALKEMLKRHPELTLTELQKRLGRLLTSQDSWHQQQASGHPVRFLANNVNRFMDGGGPVDKSREERLAELNEMRKA